MVSGVSHGGNLNQVKAKYFEAQRTGNAAAMSQAKSEAMIIMNDKQSEDTVEISQQAYSII